MRKSLKNQIHGRGESVEGPCASPTGETNDCWREGTCYTLWCVECGQEIAAYKEEAGRNAYTRGVEHITSLESKNEEKSVLWLHSIYHHDRREAYFEGPVLMNRRTELGGVRVERQRYRRWGSNN